MEDMIEKLYNLHVSTNNFPFGKPNKEVMDEEWKIYSFLYGALCEPYKGEFLRYADLCRSRQEEEYKAAYEYGFKTAINIIIQGLKE